MHPLSLDHVTITNVTPVEVIRIAGQLGCSMVNIRIHGGRNMLPLPAVVAGHPAVQREIRQAAADFGITIGVAESFPIDADVRIADFEEGLEAAAAIGAQYVNTHGLDPDRKRQIENFQAFCERAATFGLGVTLEYSRSFEINTLAAGLELVRATPGARLMVDTLHVVRGGGTAAQLRAVEPARIGWIQLNDGPAQITREYAQTESRFNRMIPGEGEFPLREIVAALPPDVPIGVEVPNKAAMDAGATPEQWAREVVTASRRLLESWDVSLRTL